jgi:hypothetical protein
VAFGHRRADGLVVQVSQLCSSIALTSTKLIQNSFLIKDAQDDLASDRLKA